MRPIAELLEFLTHKMTMMAVYQLAISLYLPTPDGFSSREELAWILSGYKATVKAKRLIF